MARPDIAALAHITTAVFDVGDTLLDTTSLMRSSLKRAAGLMRKKDLISDPSRFCDTYLEVDREVTGPAVNHLFSGLEIVEKVWNALELRPTPASVGTFLSAYRDFVRQGIGRDAGLISLFRQLRQAGYRIAVLTDGSTEEQLEQLVRLGIVGFLDAVVTSQQVGVQKPARQMFDFLFSSLAVRASHSVMVGNDPVRDISGAKEAGMLAILVTGYSDLDQRNFAPADFTVEHVCAVRQILLDRQR